jgi:hypothetical protein
MRAPPRLRQLISAAVLTALPLSATAQVTTEQSASIIVFPKVIADGTWDTVIQVANQSSNMRHARCFYVNAAPPGTDQPPGRLDAPQWAVIDFDIALTPRQPTHWVASRGRPDDSSDATCYVDKPPYCDGAGLDPGPVPALPPGFRGELLCIEVDPGGFPVPGNALFGEATLQQLATGDIAKYNAIGLHGEDTNNEDSVLCLGNSGAAACPSGAEYTPCPDTWILNHLADGTADPLGGAGSGVATSITVVPCTLDLASQRPSTVTLQFVLTNELEQTLSATTTVTCWADIPLASISPAFTRDTLGGEFVQTRIRAAGPPGGFMVVAETVRTASATGAPANSSMVNLQIEGTQSRSDVIVLPTPRAQPGAVR